MRKIILTFVVLIFSQNLWANSDLIGSFSETQIELANLLKSYSEQSLKKLGDRIGSNKLDVQIIRPSDFNDQTHRNSAFYSKNSVYLNNTLGELRKDDLIPLFLHEILSSNGIGDADYKLSQMIYWHLNNQSYISESKYLAKVVKERMELSRVFFNEPSANRTLSMSNGGSIVGGGGEYIESVIYSKFLSNAMNRRLEILGDHYIAANPSTLTSLIMGLMEVVNLQKRSCIEKDFVAYVSAKRGYSPRRATILYSKKESASSILRFLSIIERSALEIVDEDYENQFPHAMIFSDHEKFFQYLNGLGCLK